VKLFSDAWNGLKTIASEGGQMTNVLAGAASTIRGKAEAWGLIEDEREPVQYVQLPDPDGNGVPQTQQVSAGGFGVVGWISAVGLTLALLLAILILRRK